MRLDLSFSQRKLSGHVLIAYTSQGTWFLWYRSPLFHIHLPTQFSAQSASLTKACSFNDFLRSSSRTHRSTSACINYSVWFISPTLTFWSRSEHKSLIEALSISSFVISSISPLVCWPWLSKSLKFGLFSTSKASLSTIFLVESRSWIVAFWPAIYLMISTSALVSSNFSSSGICMNYVTLL